MRARQHTSLLLCGFCCASLRPSTSFGPFFGGEEGRGASVLALSAKMFVPRRPSRARPHKRRRSRACAHPAYAIGGALRRWVGVRAGGEGRLALALVERFFSWARRLVSFPLQRARFWVNVQVARVVTRKPLKIRMGKGKGGRVGTCAQVYAGT
jgi:hypothetical protein